MSNEVSQAEEAVVVAQVQRSGRLDLSRPFGQAPVLEQPGRTLVAVPSDRGERTVFAQAEVVRADLEEVVGYVLLPGGTAVELKPRGAGYPTLSPNGNGIYLDARAERLAQDHKVSTASELSFAEDDVVHWALAGHHRDIRF